ncbi:DUF202 domain-containing protein [Algivirga pacifica]|uniref:DUF202 domain-containing protein n=1 Tax=Algivirga pacifica TaxID=1162670 RepID=A0ABP9DLF7_9BACT
MKINDTLAVQRTTMANDRTLLAWVRTSLAIIALALAVLHFGPSHKGITAGAFILVFASGYCFTYGLRRYLRSRARLYKQLNRLRQAQSFELEIARRKAQGKAEGEFNL